MTAWHNLRRRVLTPDISETKVAVRGFHAKSAEAVDRLETVGRSFLTGYGAAAATGVGACASMTSQPSEAPSASPAATASSIDGPSERAR